MDKRSVPPAAPAHPAAPALSLVAARGRDGAIGVGNALPWHLPADLQHFKRLTLGRPVIMGRKTHESIGRPLPGRENIVVSRSAKVWQGCTAAASLEDALQVAGADAGDVFVAGGGEIYRAALPLAERLYITEVEADTPDGDAFFPEIDAAVWRETSRESHAAEGDAPAYAFVVYERRPSYGTPPGEEEQTAD